MGRFSRGRPLRIKATGGAIDDAVQQYYASSQRKRIHILTHNNVVNLKGNVGKKTFFPFHNNLAVFFSFIPHLINIIYECVSGEHTTEIKVEVRKGHRGVMQSNVTGAEPEPPPKQQQQQYKA